jgi:hypothetical protein
MRYFPPVPIEETMGKWPSTTVSGSGGRRCIIVLGLLACIAVAGCAPRESSVDDNRQGGFYGGVSGGMTRP